MGSTHLKFDKGGDPVAGSPTKASMTAKYLYVPGSMLRPFLDAEAAARHLNRKVRGDAAAHTRILDPAEAEAVRAHEFPAMPAIPPEGPARVCLLLDDIDRHDAGCECGACDANGKSYGVGIFAAGGNNADPLDRVYAASETSAMHNAEMKCEKNGWVVTQAPD